MAMPLRSVSIGGAKASTAMAVIGPIPAMVCHRAVTSPLAASVRSVFSRSAIFPAQTAIWST